MAKINGSPAGPDGVGGAYLNTVESDRAALWDSLGSGQGVIRGLTHSGVAGQMALSISPGSAIVAERDNAGGLLNRGYHLWTDDATVVQFQPASAQNRVDAVVAAFVDTEDGPVGAGGLDVGAHLVAVPGVSGVTTPRSDADITAWLGRGGWVRLLDVPVASTDTQINLANITVHATAPTGAWITYTPAWSQTNGANLSVGNGSLTGSYTVDENNVVHGRVLFTRGSTTNQGTETYRWSLPVNYKEYRVHGVGVVRRGTSEYPVIVKGIGSNNVVLILPGGGTTAGTRVAPSSFAWAAGDEIAFDFTYEAA